jgi:hypothetical protein
MKINPLPAWFVLPAQRVNVKAAGSAPIGSTKSSITGSSRAATVPPRGFTAATRMTGLCDWGQDETQGFYVLPAKDVFMMATAPRAK